jgi:hypothetical protein
LSICTQYANRSTSRCELQWVARQQQKLVAYYVGHPCRHHVFATVSYLATANTCVCTQQNQVARHVYEFSLEARDTVGAVRGNFVIARHAKASFGRLVTTLGSAELATTHTLRCNLHMLWLRRSRGLSCHELAVRAPHATNSHARNAPARVPKPPPCIALCANIARRCSTMSPHVAHRTVAIRNSSSRNSTNASAAASSRTAWFACSATPAAKATSWRFRATVARCAHRAPVAACQL